MADIDYALGLERGILGICLLEPTSLLRVEQHLTAADFADRRHARLFDVMIEMRKRGEDMGAINVGLELQRLGASADLSAELVSGLIEEPASLDPRSLDERIRRLRDEVERRKAESALEGTIRALRDRTVPLADTLAIVRQSINEAEKTQTKRELPAIAGVVDEMLSQLETGWPSGTPTCVPTLDWAIQGGIKPTQLVVLAGWTGSGKTSLSTQIAVRVANWASRDVVNRGWVLIFSFEMGEEELVSRFVQQAAPLVDGFRPPDGFSRRDRPKVRKAFERLRDLPISIEAEIPRTVEAVRGATERFIVEHGQPALIIVDHIHLMKDPGVRGGRSEEIAAITGALKSMAMQLRVPILALAQMNREVGKRDTHEPQLTDLKESGAIEQDANIVLMVHRPSAFYTDPAERALEEQKGADAFVFVSKNRSGPTGKVSFDWIGPRYLFREKPEEVEKLKLGIAFEDFDLSIGAITEAEEEEAVGEPDERPLDIPSGGDAATETTEDSSDAAANADTTDDDLFS